jgi:hypothetical protein
VRRWPGQGDLLIEDVKVRGADGREQAVFKVGSAMTIDVAYRAMRSGEYPVIFGIVIFCLDGTNVSQNISSLEALRLAAGELRSAKLEFQTLDLANGRYVISISLHKTLDPYQPDDTVRYDLLAQSYEFEIVGNPPLRTALYVLPGTWRI